MNNVRHHKFKEKQKVEEEEEKQLVRNACEAMLQATSSSAMHQNSSAQIG